MTYNQVPTLLHTKISRNFQYWDIFPRCSRSSPMVK